MNTTNIEWVKSPDGSQGCTLNGKTGCKNHTPEGLCLDGLFPCYAFKVAHGRLKPLYLKNLNIALPHENPKLAFDDPFYPRFWFERLKEPYQIKKPISIFLDDMSDWMGDYWPREWTEVELQMMSDNPQHRFYTLTKQPQNLPQFSPFPENCWVGVTATKFEAVIGATKWLAGVKATVKYLSLEPLLDWQTYNERDLPWRLWKHAGITWLIIGACTGIWVEMAGLRLTYPELSMREWGNKWTAQPCIEDLQEIVESADKAGIKVFLKDNLKPLLSYPQHLWAFSKVGGLLRQEVPE